MRTNRIPTAPNTLARQHHPAYLFATGLCMGAADVVPGVSGGTMAFVMGVYHELLNAIKSFDVALIRDLFGLRLRDAMKRIPFRFLIPLGLGIVTAVLSLAELLSYLLKHHEALLFSFFFGLIVASIVALAARHAWTLIGVLGCAIGSVLAYWLVGLVPADPGHSPLVLFGSGAIAICAMILPGISGSFILLILGQYGRCVESISQLLAAIKTLDVSMGADALFGTILPVGAGAVIGLALFTRILSWLLRHYGSVTIAGLIGFMIGSLRRIWPFKDYLEFGVDRHGEPIPLRWQNIWPSIAEDRWALSLGLFLVGFLLISAIDHIYDRRNPIVLLLTQGRWSVSDATTVSSEPS